MYIADVPNSITALLKQGEVQCFLSTFWLGFIGVNAQNSCWLFHENSRSMPFLLNLVNETMIFPLQPLDKWRKNM